MAPNRFMSEIDFAKTQLAVYFVILLLAVDVVNPVKIFLHVFPAVAPWHIAAISILACVYVFVSQIKDLLYFGVKVFFHSILSIFFRQVEIIGRHNIPTYGPVIFTGNHANQFVDAVTILCTCQHDISYIIAESSWTRPFIGHLAWALGAVPVKRPQDSAYAGTGNIRLSRDTDAVETNGHHQNGEKENTNKLYQPKQNGNITNGNGNHYYCNGEASDKEDEEEEEEEEEDIPTPQIPPPSTTIITVEGFATLFSTELAVGDKIRLPKSSIALKIVRIESDTKLFVEDAPDPTALGILPYDNPVKFDILKKIDQKQVYEKVLDRLANGGAIGIFPEGGSHDRTDLLPFKVGVALIAYSALEKDGLMVPIVPVGLNYFRGHRFRGRAIVEFGTPSYVDPATLGDYKTGGEDRRRVCNELLARLEDSMRSVIVAAPDYETLQLIHTARRLYQRTQPTPSEKQDLSRRFAVSYRVLLQRTKGNPPPDFLELQNKLMGYQRELNELGIRDYQVPALGRESQVHDIDGDTFLREMKIPSRIGHLVVSWVLASVPGLLLNLPIGLLARMYANRRRKVALAKSKVKIKGLDVMLSERILICCVLVPSLWVLYGFLLFFYTNLDGPSIALAFVAMPVFSYMGVIAAEAGMVDLKDLRPYIMRLFPSTRRRIAALPDARKLVQADLRQFVKKLGPTLGELYYAKELDWKSIVKNVRRVSEMGADEEEIDAMLRSSEFASGTKKEK